MSYYVYYAVICDQLAFDRLVEAWKQKEWFDICELKRPERVWVVSQDSDRHNASGLYLMYTWANYGQSAWVIDEWISEVLGLDPKHFSIWSRGECDKKWNHAGCMTDANIPEYMAIAEYGEDDEDRMRAPAGYRTYEYCHIAVDPNVCTEYEIDYTRDEGIKQQSPEEELLLSIVNSLDRVEELMGLMLRRMEE